MIKIDAQKITERLTEAGLIGLIWVLLAGSGLGTIAGDNPIVIATVSMVLLVQACGLILIVGGRELYKLTTVIVRLIREKTNQVSGQTKPPAATAL